MNNTTKPETIHTLPIIYSLAPPTLKSSMGVTSRIVLEERDLPLLQSEHRN